MIRRMQCIAKDGRRDGACDSESAVCLRRQLSKEKALRRNERLSFLLCRVSGVLNLCKER